MKQQLLPRSTPEAEGLSSEVVASLVATMNRMVQQGKRVHAYQLMRHGKVISEGAWAPYPQDAQHQLFSLSKSFVSSAIGIAQGEGLLTIDDRLIDFFPEYLSDRVTERMRRVTLRHLLTMSSGHDGCAIGRFRNKPPQPGWVKIILEDELPFEPGEKFIYNSGATFLLSAVLQKVTGQRVSAYLERRLFEPLGIRNVYWEQNPDGIDIGGWGLWVTLEQLAVFGQLWLQGGMWEGRQLIPRDYVFMASHKEIENETKPWRGTVEWKMGYGFQFWMCRYRSFRGDGFAGQIALMMPEQDIVLVMLAGLGGMQEELDIAFDHLVDAVSYRALPENTQSLTHLRALEQSLRLPMAVEAALPKERVAVGLKREIVLGENVLGLQAIALETTANGVELCYRFDNREATVLAGYDESKINQTPWLCTNPLLYAAQAGWVSEDELRVNLLPIGTPCYYTLHFRFEGTHCTLNQRTAICFEGVPEITLEGEWH